MYIGIEGNESSDQKTKEQTRGVSDNNYKIPTMSIDTNSKKKHGNEKN
jgi:hypothetical protein